MFMDKRIMSDAAYALINRQALLHNLAIVRQIAPKAKVMAVIKANAYGHGLSGVARWLDGQADSLAVARTDEALLLRQQGFKLPIVVLQGFAGSDELDLYRRYQLEAVIHQSEQLRLLNQRGSHDNISVWLKMDTGMSRLGFLPAQWQAAYQVLQNNRNIQQPVGLMTHLASADETDNPQTAQQLQRFYQLAANLPGRKSIANSAAILSCQDALSDWVRPGLMLYGVSPFPDKSAESLGLKPVMTLKSRLISIKTVAAGETVGYGGAWHCDKATRIGIVSIGYGDGYPRYAKSGTPVLVNGRKVRLIGRVSMDMLALDLSTAAEVKIGDPVTLWGEGLAVEAIAQCAGTIPYTLLCGITARVKRIEQYG
jgi:alanine racemase